MLSRWIVAVLIANATLLSAWSTTAEAEPTAAKPQKCETVTGSNLCRR